MVTWQHIKKMNLIKSVLLVSPTLSFKNMAYNQSKKRSGSFGDGTASHPVSGTSQSSAFKVAVRLRPLLEKERKESASQVFAGLYNMSCVAARHVRSFLVCQG